jgi:CspA family cold shock protein
MNQRETGIVKWFDDRKGYGFITRDSGGDVFVHYNSINGVGFRSLLEGQRVEFSVIEGDKGPQAQEVSVVNLY